MLIRSYKLLPVFTLGFLKEIHISGQQIKYITVYRNWSEASMHCIQMRPAGIQGKQKFSKLHPKKLHTKTTVRMKKRHKVSFFAHSNECDRTTPFCLYESKGPFHSGEESKGPFHIFLFCSLNYKDSKWGSEANFRTIWDRAGGEARFSLEKRTLGYS